jgi:PAS domain S-box-containing protein
MSPDEPSDQARLRSRLESLEAELAEYKQAAEALASTTARTNGILEAAVDGIITIDETGTIESVNPAVGQLFGYRPNELIGRNVKVLMPPPFEQEHDGYLAHYRRTGQRRIIGIGR